MTVGGSGPPGTGTAATARAWVTGCLGVRACAAGGVTLMAIARVSVDANGMALRQPDLQVAGVLFDIV